MTRLIVERRSAVAVTNRCAVEAAVPIREACRVAVRARAAGEAAVAIVVTPDLVALTGANATRRTAGPDDDQHNTDDEEGLPHVRPPFPIR